MHAPRRSHLLAPACALLLATPLDARAAPRFDDALDNLGAQACGGGGCWTNYLRVADLDLDDDLDIVFVNYSGFFSMGAPQPLVTMVNNGDAVFTDHSDTILGGYTERLRQVAIGDVDGDGAPDIVAPSAWGDASALFINNGDGTFDEEGAARLPATSVYAGAVRLGDVDGDHDLDIVIGDGYAQGAGHPTVAALWLNDGAGVFEDASGGLPTDKQGYDPDDIDLVDIDRDLDLDLLINVHAGKSSLWLNDGGGGFTDATDQLADMPGPPNQGGAYHYNMSPCDVDGDGDLDLWIDNTGPGYTEQLMINDGAGNFTDETGARVSGNPGSDDNGVLCADLDDDGDLDAVVLALNFGQATTERLLVNDGDGNFTYESGAFPNVLDPTLWGEFGDLNGDGKLDLVTGQGEGNPELNRVYLGNAALPADSHPPRFPIVEALGDIETDTPRDVRFAVVDNAVTDGGPRLLEASVEYELDGEAQPALTAWAMGGDLFVAEFPGLQAAAVVTYRACATDLAGNVGCAEEQSFTVQDEPGTTASGSSGDPSETGDPSTTDGDPTAGPTTADSSPSTSDGPTTDGDDDDDDDGTDSEAGADTDGSDGGCGCASGDAPQGLLALVGLTLLGVGRRRRTARVNTAGRRVA
ncbi:MAG: VCBS repeat-containing protein [Myxococcales bacterium]|nr:VCBS repeat-containing protein [Myxococcales bacterium]